MLDPRHHRRLTTRPSPRFHPTQEVTIITAPNSAALAAQARALSDQDLATEADLAGISPAWEAAVLDEQRRRLAQATIDRVVAAVPDYLRDFAYIDYRDELGDDAIAELLSGDEARFQDAACEVDDRYAESRCHGRRSYIDDDVDPDDLAIIEAADMSGHLDDALQEIDTSDPLSALIDREDRVMIRLATGYDVEPDSWAWDEATYAQAVSDLAGHLTSLGVDDLASRRMADELIANATYGGRVCILWSANLKPLVDWSSDVAFEQTPADEQRTLTFDGGSPEVLVYDGLNGSGHSVSPPDGTTLTVTAAFEALRWDHGSYSWSDDIAGISRGAFEADPVIAAAA